MEHTRFAANLVTFRLYKFNATALSLLCC